MVGLSRLLNKVAVFNLVNTKSTRKAFTMLLKFRGAYWATTKVSAHIRLDAKFPELLDELHIFCNISECRYKRLRFWNWYLKWGRKSSTRTNFGNCIPQGLVSILWLLLHISAIILLFKCYKIIGRSGLERFYRNCQEPSVKSVGTMKERMNSVSREHTVCFYIPDDGYYYIVVRIYDFTDVIHD